MGQVSKDILDPKTATMWWAGKHMSRNEKLEKYVGRNEKTKIVVKLTKVWIVTPNLLQNYAIYPVAKIFLFIFSCRVFFNFLLQNEITSPIPHWCIYYIAVDSILFVSKSVFVFSYAFSYRRVGVPPYGNHRWIAKLRKI